MDVFDVAISFAGTERQYARAIAAIATENGLKVFLDEMYQAHLWGENLVEELSDIYSKKAQYCVVIVSKDYSSRIYTNVERRAALDRAIQHRTSYILPVVVDDSWIQGLPRATAYVDLRQKSVITICRLLIEKIRGVAPDKLKIPSGIAITRLPTAGLSADELSTYLMELCAQSKNTGVIAFGCLIYDEGTVELRKLLRDPDYWDALDQASGARMEVFCIRDKVAFEGPKYIEMMVAGSIDRPRSRGHKYSKLLKDYFGEEKTRLVYPSFLFFLVGEGKITHCRLIPLPREETHKVFLRLQALFGLIAESLEKCAASEKTADETWEFVREKLHSEYTLYIQRPPNDTAIAIASLAKYVDDNRGVT